MTEQGTDQTLRDQATAAEMSATEHRRQAERLQALLDERTAQLVQVTIERDEARRELDQVQGAERAVRLRVVRAGIDGQPFIAVADIRADLESGGVS